MTPRAKRVLNAVAEFHRISVREILSTDTRRHISAARCHAMLSLRALPGKAKPQYSYPQIGAFLNRDHSTVMTGVARAMQLGLKPLAEEPDPECVA